MLCCVSAFHGKRELPLISAVCSCGPDLLRTWRNASAREGMQAVVGQATPDPLRWIRFEKRIQYLPDLASDRHTDVHPEQAHAAQRLEVLSGSAAECSKE